MRTNVSSEEADCEPEASLGVIILGIISTYY